MKMRKKEKKKCLNKLKTSLIKFKKAKLDILKNSFHIKLKFFNNI